MQIKCSGLRMRIYVGESDRWEGQPLFDAIVRAAHEQGLAGATVYRGIEGFGTQHRIHTVKVLHLSERLPIVVELIDAPERIEQFKSTVESMVVEGLVTVEPVEYFLCRQDANAEIEFQDDGEPPSSPPGENEHEEAGRQDSLAPLAERASKIIELAKSEASRSRRPFIDSVDVLLALLRESEGIAGKVLADLNIDVQFVERCLREYVDRDPPSGDYAQSLDRISRAEAKWLRHNNVGTEHLLLALCEIRPSAATDILMRIGASPREVCQDVLQVLGRHADWQRWIADHPAM